MKWKAKIVLLLNLQVLWRIVLHFHDYILWLFISIDTFVEDFDNPGRRELARVLICREFSLLCAKDVFIGVNLNLEPVLDVVLVGIACFTHFIQ